MNMKISIAIMLLLVSGIFATTMVVAENVTEDVVGITAEKLEAVEIANPISEEIGSADVIKGVVSIAAGGTEVVEIANIVSEEIGSTDVIEVVEELEESSNKKRIGFVKVLRGHGWIDNGEEGHLITGLWAIQKFANVNTDTEEVEEKSFVRAFGRIHIAGSGMYKLIRYKNEISEETVNFYVIPLREKVSIDDAEAVAVGKLSLTTIKSLKGLTTWEGSLNFDSGDLTGSWDVELGTNIRKVRPRKLVDVEKVKAVKDKALGHAGVESIADLTEDQKTELKAEAKKVVKKSFWSKFRFWRGR